MFEYNFILLQETPLFRAGTHLTCNWGQALFHFLLLLTLRLKCRVGRPLIPSDAQSWWGENTKPGVPACLVFFFQLNHPTAMILILSSAENSEAVVYCNDGGHLQDASPSPLSGRGASARPSLPGPGLLVCKPRTKQEGRHMVSVLGCVSA